ncbi:hypothetical protein HK105_200134 [Polyrhizophydium stewartii]|uniref:DRBM domain-containing protein n=1 Tax=Polyrhizophydium stewartii TaxID=2732419 RepID=A0ABR4NKK7_9FUNG|nr:hypothetical protein HK105_004732 [Polyrhizophydium stewartii]
MGSSAPHEKSYKDIIVQYLRQSENVALLNEYCQKCSKPLPRWTQTSKPQGANSYLHTITLVVDGYKFEASGVANTSDGRKLVATSAIEFLTSKGIGYFSRARDANYISLLQSLTQAVDTTVPLYTDMTAPNANLTGKPFLASVTALGKTFECQGAFSKKQAARINAARLAFDALVEDVEVHAALSARNPNLAFSTAVRQAGGSGTYGFATRGVSIRPVGSEGAQDLSLPIQHPAVTVDTGFVQERQRGYIERPSRDSQPLGTQSTSSSLDPLLPYSAIPPLAHPEEHDYVDLLESFLNDHPDIGKSIYSYRAVDSQSGQQLNKAQLIVNKFVYRTSKAHVSQTDACNEVARRAYDELRQQFGEPQPPNLQLAHPPAETVNAGLLASQAAPSEASSTLGAASSRQHVLELDLIRQIEQAQSSAQNDKAADLMTRLIAMRDAHTQFLRTWASQNLSAAPGAAGASFHHEVLSESRSLRKRPISTEFLAPVKQQRVIE